MYNPYMYQMYGYPQYQAAAAMQAANPQLGFGFGAPAVPATPAPAGGSPKAASTAAPTGERRDKKGKGKGKGKERDSAVGHEADKPQAAEPPPNKEFVGSLKSLSKTRYYGFFVCDEAKETFGRDVWVDSRLLPDNV